MATEKLAVRFINEGGDVYRRYRVETSDGRVLGWTTLYRPGQRSRWFWTIFSSEGLLCEGERFFSRRDAAARLVELSSAAGEAGAIGRGT